MALPVTVDTGQVYTADQFMILPLDPNKRYELVRGIIKEMSHPGGEHMLITSNLSRALWRWIFSQPTAGTEGSQGEGRVLPPGGFQLKIPGATRDTVRPPDLAYVPPQLVEALNAPGAVTFPPDLAVEVYSPNDRPGDLHDKLTDYQAAGWNVVWVIYPLDASPKRKAGTVEVYHLHDSLEALKSLGRDEVLTGEGSLDGFTMPVNVLFGS